MELLEADDYPRKVERAINLLRNIPQDTEIELSYSGGKDSDVILELAKMAGFLANLFCNMCIASSSGRSNSQQTNPNANIFLQRRADLLSRPNSVKPSFTIVEIGAATTCTPPSPSSWNGSSVVNCALSRSLFWNESVSIKTIALGFRFFTFTFSAAGFIATSTSALSPGVKILRDPR